MNKLATPKVPIFLFFVLPFAGLIAAVRSYKAVNAKNMVWLFIIFYGFTFVYTNHQMDANRYAKSLIYLYKQPVNSASDFFSLLYSKESNYVDLLQPLLTFLVSRFTDDPRILFTFFGVIFGYFYSRNIWFLFSFVKNKVKREALPFIIMAAFAISIWQMNGFRFWTAAHVFAYGFFLFLSGKPIRGLVISLASILVHFSFIFPVIVLLIYVIAGNRLFIYFILYILSFFISVVTPTTFSGYTKSLPGVFQERTDRYTSKAYLKRLDKAATVKVNWYIEGRLAAIRLAINFLLVITMINYRKFLNTRKVELSLLSFSLLIGSVVNVLSSVPSVHRFYFLFYLLIFSFFFLLVQGMRERTFRWWVKAPVFIAILLFVVVEFRVGFDTMGVMTLIGNPLTAPFIQDEAPLINLIR
ncbi:MAG: EpsG family protein [Cyclobacteriaceae bacterium]|nr:EpsG family protein [Cyclobacteriaceae bacterium]